LATSYIDISASNNNKSNNKKIKNKDGGGGKKIKCKHMNNLNKNNEIKTNLSKIENKFTAVLVRST
jgi:hypothetical protein